MKFEEASRIFTAIEVDVSAQYDHFLCDNFYKDIRPIQAGQAMNKLAGECIMCAGYTLKEIIGLGFSELYGITFNKILGEKVDTQPDEDDVVSITITIDHQIDRQNLPNKMIKKIEMQYQWYRDIGETLEWNMRELTQLNNDE